MAITNLLDEGFFRASDLYYRAVDIWRNNVVGGLLATIGGGAVYLVMERVPEPPVLPLSTSAALALGGIASIGYGMGRLSEISRQYAVMQDKPEGPEAY